MLESHFCYAYLVGQEGLTVALPFQGQGSMGVVLLFQGHGDVAGTLSCQGHRDVVMAWPCQGQGCGLAFLRSGRCKIIVLPKLLHCSL